MTQTASMISPAEEKVRLLGFNHVAMPVRDREEGIRFWQAIMDAEVIENLVKEDFAFIKMPGGFYFGLSGMPGPNAFPLNRPEHYSYEYPHFAFTVPPDMMDPIKARLDRYGVRTHEIWTRFQVEVLMYFRDPSGNLFELYCPEGYHGAKSVPRAKFVGGTYEPDVAALHYDTWNDPGKGTTRHSRAG